MTMDAQVDSDLTPIERVGIDGKQYYSYICSKCGGEARNSYMEPIGSRMLAARHCWNCDYWQEFEQRLERDHKRMTIIDGHVYGPGSRTSGSFLGMAGRRFDIEYVEPSAFAGKRITTNDLWSGSTLPGDLKERFPDTARFLGGAEKVSMNGEITTCWNPSDPRAEQYPRPSTLDLA